MIARTELAILHFNDATKYVPRDKFQLSKTSEMFVLKPIKTATERKFIDDLMLEVINLTQKPYSYKSELPALPDLYSYKPEL